jgi:hypothetical protein
VREVASRKDAAVETMTQEALTLQVLMMALSGTAMVVMTNVGIMKLGSLEEHLLAMREVCFAVFVRARGE